MIDIFNFWSIILPVFLTFAIYFVWFDLRDILMQGRSRFDQIIGEVFVLMLGFTVWIIYFNFKYWLLR
jgi:hypothetical protein